MLFWPKTDVPESNSRRECYWPYLIGQHPLSPVFGQKRPGASNYSYFAQLPPVFRHSVFRVWTYYVPFRSTTRTDQQGPQEQLTVKFRPVTWRMTNFSHFSLNNFGANHSPPCLSGGCSKALLHAFGLTMTQTRTTTRRTGTYKQMSTERCMDCRQNRQLMAGWTEGVPAELCGGC